MSRDIAISLFISTDGQSIALRAECPDEATTMELLAYDRAPIFGSHDDIRAGLSGPLGRMLRDNHVEHCLSCQSDRALEGRRN